MWPDKRLTHGNAGIYYFTLYKFSNPPVAKNTEKFW